ncbi:MAG: hypothetical protein ABIN58_05685 [candidate division WOR-3 bacterium]
MDEEIRKIHEEIQALRRVVEGLPQTIVECLRPLLVAGSREAEKLQKELEDAEEELVQLRDRRGEPEPGSLRVKLFCTGAGAGMILFPDCPEANITQPSQFAIAHTIIEELQDTDAFYLPIGFPSPTVHWTLFFVADVHQEFSVSAGNFSVYQNRINAAFLHARGPWFLRRGDGAGNRPVALALSVLSMECSLRKLFENYREAKTKVDQAQQALQQKQLKDASQQLCAAYEFLTRDEDGVLTIDPQNFPGNCLLVQVGNIAANQQFQSPLGATQQRVQQARNWLANQRYLYEKIRESLNQQGLDQNDFQKAEGYVTTRINRISALGVQAASPSTPQLPGELANVLDLIKQYRNAASEEKRNRIWTQWIEQAKNSVALRLSQDLEWIEQAKNSVALRLSQELGRMFPNMSKEDRTLDELKGDVTEALKDMVESRLDLKRCRAASNPAGYFKGVWRWRSFDKSIRRLFDIEDTVVTFSVSAPQFPQEWTEEEKKHACQVALHKLDRLAEVPGIRLERTGGTWTLTVSILSAETKFAYAVKLHKAREKEPNLSGADLAHSVGIPDYAIQEIVALEQKIRDRIGSQPVPRDIPSPPLQPSEEEMADDPPIIAPRVVELLAALNGGRSLDKVDNEIRDLADAICKVFPRIQPDQCSERIRSYLQDNPDCPEEAPKFLLDLLQRTGLMDEGSGL